MKNYFGISRDHSISMGCIATAAMHDYNATIATIREAATREEIDTIVNVIKCGATRQGGVQFDVVNSSVHALKPLSDYPTTSGNTPLLDSVGELIARLEQAPDAADANTTFLVMTITDGEENSSLKWTTRSLSTKIQQLQSTGRWTFTFRVPRGHRASTARIFGVPIDNVLEWDNSARGMMESTVSTVSAMDNYYTAVRSGVKSTAKFYTNLADVSSKEIQKNLVDISSQIKLWITTDKEVIRPYCERMSGKPFVKGAAFYQLTKPEPEVQDYKMIAIRDMSNGKVYAGAAARAMLGLPQHGTVYVKPGDHGQYDIYIQSTSINRVLPVGTQVLYWPTYASPAQPPVAAPAPAVSAPTQATVVKATLPPSNLTKAIHTSKWIGGYKAGFVDGKAKAAKAVKVSKTDTEWDEWYEGYAKGYKDGRGKRKRLYK